MRLSRLIIGIFLGILTFGVAPTPPPYSRFVVDGSITRPGANDLSGIGIILLGQMPQDSVFRILKGRTEGESSIALTDPMGAFAISLSSWERMDSLKIGVIILDMPTVTGPSFKVDSSLGIEITEQYEARGEPVCGGCIVNSETKERVVGYSYYFSNKTVSIPF